MKKITLFLVVFLILTCFGNVFTGVAFADTASKYTDVLEDLSKDETFDAAQYPASDKDEMDVIQIAESSAGELFLYVYSTTGDKFVASEARISQSIGENLQPKDYKLTLLSRNGTLSKYIVNELTVRQDTVRYYVVIQLARPWDKDVDKEPPVNTAKTVPYQIGKQFTACTVDGNVSYSCIERQSIEVVAKYVGYIEYLNGFALFTSYCDSHYVAFDTNIDMDVLYEADVDFIPIKYLKMRGAFGGEKYLSKEPLEKQSVTLKYDTVVNNDKLLFGKKYEWNRIESVADFVVKENLTDEARENLKDKTWVLRFYESECKSALQINGTTNITGTLVEDVTILRLKFEANGEVYNLGVVDNKQAGSDEPSNPAEDAVAGLEAAMKRVTDFFNSVGDCFVKAGQWLAKNWWVIIVGVVVISIAISLFFRVGRQLLAAIFTGIGKALWWFVKYLGIGLFYVITSPYWLIRAIVLKVREKRGG